MEKSTHELLVEAYLKYFKVNENFEQNFSVRNHVKSRRHLREIRKYAKMRMDEIHEDHQREKAIKREAWKRRRELTKSDGMDISRKTDQRDSK